MPPEKGNLRRHDRPSVSAIAEVAWRGAHGLNLRVKGRVLDISKSGIRLEVVEEIALRAIVHVKCTELGISVAGSVRHCRRVGTKFAIGIEFMGESA